MIRAEHLSVGDEYRTADGVWHRVAGVGVLSHRINVEHTDGQVRSLFPGVPCELRPVRTLDEVAEHIPVIYLDGDEGREQADILFNVEGVVSHGITDESARAVFDHLVQWHTPGSDVEGDDLGLGGDDRWVVLEDRWIVSGHSGLGYVALAEVTRWAS